MRHRLLHLCALTALWVSHPTYAEPPTAAAYLPSLAHGDVRMPVHSFKATRAAGTLRQQFDFSCGSAALATLLTHHYQHPIGEAEIFAEMFAAGDQAKIQREGFSLLDMKRFLHSRGFIADGFQLPLDKLRESNTPAIVLINDNGYLHFVVVKGLQGDRVLVGDPANGTRSMRRDQFEAQWQTKLLFVVHSHIKQARFNQAADWRAAPAAPVHAGARPDALFSATLPKRGPGDF